MPRTSNVPNQIISLINADPSITRRQIEDRLNVGYSAVQKQIKRLIDAGVIETGFRVRESRLTHRLKFWIFIETRYNSKAAAPSDGLAPDYQRQLCQDITTELLRPEYADHLLFGSVQVLLGADCDVVLVLYADDARHVLRFVTRFLRTRPSVLSTATGWTVLNDPDGSDDPHDPNEPEEPGERQHRDT